jgi:hypothetical protein
MAGLSDEELCRVVLTTIWRERGRNAIGVAGEALHAHAIESLVSRFKQRLPRPLTHEDYANCGHADYGGEPQGRRVKQHKA